MSNLALSLLGRVKCHKEGLEYLGEIVVRPTVGRAKFRGKVRAVSEYWSSCESAARTA
jgi:hypothetical protein